VSAGQDPEFLNAASSVGELVAIAIGMGIQSKQDYLTTTIQTAIQTALDSIGENGLESGYELKIRPVLDMSNLGGPQSLLTATPGFSMSSPKITNTVQVVKDNSDVVRAINALDGRITNLTTSTVNAISNLKLTINGGVLVGQIAPTIDRSLGSKASGGTYSSGANASGGRGPITPQ
jgi:hypothetical protein